MQTVSGRDYHSRIKDQVTMCFTFEMGRKRICIGASGRKLRQVCIYCPNWIHYVERGREKDNGNESKELYGTAGGDRGSDRIILHGTAADHVGADRGDDD